MKKIIILTFVFLLLQITAYGDNKIECYVPDFTIAINGEVKELDSSIISLNDRTYLPVRNISELLELYVVWNEDLRRIEISDIGKISNSSTHRQFVDTDTVTAYKTDMKIKIDGYEKKLENDIIVVNDLSYLPVRELSELLGFEVTWDSGRNAIGIEKHSDIVNIPELYPFKKDNLWGYIDENGIVRIEPKYTEVYDFSENLAVAGILTNDEYFSENNIEAPDTHIAYGYINKKGDFVIEPKYYEAVNFSDGLAAVVEKKGHENNGVFFESYGYFSFIDYSGNVVISGKYPAVYSFNNGFASVYNAEGECGILDKSGNFRKVDDTVGYLNYGKYISDKKVMDANSEVVFDASKYDKIRYIFNDFLSVIKNEKTGLVDYSGSTIIDCKYEEIIYDENSNTVLFKENGKYGYMDLNGNVIIKPEYDCAWIFKDGIAVVWNDESCSIINMYGEILADNVGDVEKVYSRNMICISDGDNKKYINFKGEKIEPLF